MSLSLNIASVIWAFTVLAGTLLIRDVFLRYLRRDQSTPNIEIEASLLAHIEEHKKQVQQEPADLSLVAANFEEHRKQLARHRSDIDKLNRELDAVSRAATSAAIAAGLTPDKL